MIKDHRKHYHEIVKLMEDLGTSIPDTINNFNALHKTSISDGVLSSKTKELIALGIAIAVRCDGCIAFHVHDALRAGVTSQEIIEAIGVAILMGGGPAVVYGCEALEALKQFEEAAS